MSRSKKKPKESPSKKLRNVFYKLYIQDNEGYEVFDRYYESKLFKLITHYKNLIK